MNDDNINIKKIYTILKDNWKNIFKTTLVFFLISLVYVNFKTDYYKSTISLYAAGELDDSSLLGQYGSLAENLGFATTPSSNYYIPDIIESRSLKSKIINKKWNTTIKEEPINLKTYWGIDKVGFINRIFNFISSIFSSNKFNQKKGIVFWGSTNVDKYGYNHNFNYISELPYAMYFNGDKIEKAILELMK